MTGTKCGICIKTVRVVGILLSPSYCGVLLAYGQPTAISQDSAACTVP